MKTLHAYFGRIKGKTLKVSNEYPDLCTDVRHIYWCEDFKTTPDLKGSVEATYDDVEAYADIAGINEILINRCH